MVRDPFLRLVSAYQDKLASLAEGGIGGLPSLASEIRKYLDITDKEPISFQQLLEYIAGVADGPMDKHIDTFNRLCRPCEVKYDFIGKMETLLHDAEYLFRNILQTNHSL